MGSDVSRTSPLVASDTMVRVAGSAGAAVVASAVIVSTFGTVNAPRAHTAARVLCDVLRGESLA